MNRILVQYHHYWYYHHYRYIYPINNLNRYRIPNFGKIVTLWLLYNGFFYAEMQLETHDFTQFSITSLVIIGKCIWSIEISENHAKTK